MRRTARTSITVALVVALVVTVYFIGHANRNATAGADARSSHLNASFSAFYLDMGASASLGFQPTGVAHHNGRRTNTGYANDLLYIEALKHIALTLRQVGCPAETVQSIINTKEQDHCYTLPKTQLTQSVAFLQQNQSEPGLVTLDFGFNNLRLCLDVGPINESCVASALAAAAVDMPKTLAVLKHAAGPHVLFVGLEYNDPYLAYYLRGAAGPAEATETLSAVDRMNTVLAHVYANAHVKVADVPAYFNTDDTTRVTVPNVGVIPQNVESACEYTWMCYGAPFGPDDHPNDAGYALIAQAIAAQLPASW